MPLILLTRPEPDARRFADLLAARGHQALVAPVLDIFPCAWSEKNGVYGGVVLTSRHALPAFSARRELHVLPCFIVGDETARQAEALGCLHVNSAPTAAALAGAIARGAPFAAPLLYLRGKDVSHNMAAALDTHGITVEEAVVYEAAPRRALPAAVCTALAAGEVAAAPFFSARSARAFLQLAAQAELERALAQIDAVAISVPVAEVLADAKWRSITVSSAPDAAAMAEAIDKCVSRRYT